MGINNMNEEWVKWNIDEAAFSYTIYRVENTLEYFKITLLESEDESRGLTITFKDYVWSYRSLDEGFAQRTSSYLNNKYGADFYCKGSFFKVQNSSYLSWLHHESMDIYRDIGLVHYCILSADNRLDIIDNGEPVIEFFGK